MTVKYHMSANGMYNICPAQIRCRLGGEHVTRAEMSVTANLENDDQQLSPFHAVIEKLDSYDQVHWRLYLPRGKTEPVAVCLQSFDYYEYDSSRFVDSEVYDSADEAGFAARDFNEVGAPAAMRRKVSKAEATYRSNLKNSKTGTEAFGDVLSQLPSHDAVHWRPYLLPNGNVKMVCVQYFDYWERDGDRFLGTDVYDSAEEAQAALPQWQ